MIHPSPALVVRAETPIFECVTLMKTHNVGSVIVVSDDFRSDIVGIFTEKDLVQKLDHILRGNHWQSAIAAVMSHPIISVDFSELGRAGEIMLKHHFRHLPVVMSFDGVAKLVGVISMRDVLRSKISEDAIVGVPKLSKLKERKIGFKLFTLNPSFSEFTKRVLESMRHDAVVSVCSEPSDLADTGSGSETVWLVDLDGLETRQLKEVLKTAMNQPRLELTTLFYDPAKMNAKGSEAIAKLKLGPHVGIFKKPVNIIALSDFLSRLS